MKICTILVDPTLDNEEDKYLVMMLCDYCFEADAKRAENAYVIDHDQYVSDVNVSCEICYKSLAEELDEMKL